MSTRALLSIAILCLFAGCASQPRLVQKLAAEDLYCERSAVEVAYLDQDYSGGFHYEAHGCGGKRNYVCKRMAKEVMLAAVGYVDFDQRRCRREML